MVGLLNKAFSVNNEVQLFVEFNNPHQRLKVQEIFDALNEATNGQIRLIKAQSYHREEARDLPPGVKSNPQIIAYILKNTV